MNSSEPNYRMYSVDQLNDALNHIDRERFPDRVASIEKYLKNPGPRATISKDKRVEISENSKALFGYLSIELIFWVIVILGSCLGLLVW